MKKDNNQDGPGFTQGILKNKNQKREGRLVKTEPILPRILRRFVVRAKTLKWAFCLLRIFVWIYDQFFGD